MRSPKNCQISPRGERGGVPTSRQQQLENQSCPHHAHTKEKTNDIHIPPTTATTRKSKAPTSPQQHLDNQSWPHFAPNTKKHKGAHISPTTKGKGGRGLVRRTQKWVGGLVGKWAAAKGRERVGGGERGVKLVRPPRHVFDVWFLGRTPPDIFSMFGFWADPPRHFFYVGFSETPPPDICSTSQNQRRKSITFFDAFLAEYCYFWPKNNRVLQFLTQGTPRPGTFYKRDLWAHQNRVPSTNEIYEHAKTGCLLQARSVRLTKRTFSEHLLTKRRPQDISWDGPDLCDQRKPNFGGPDLGVSRSSEGLWGGGLQASVYPSDFQSPFTVIESCLGPKGFFLNHLSKSCKPLQWTSPWCSSDVHCSLVVALGGSCGCGWCSSVVG